MKRILTALCALILLVAGVTPAMAQPAAGADPTLAVESPAPSPSPEPGRSCYYPISVEEYTYGPLDELRVSKVYQLSLGDDPSGIPTDDFDRGGRHFYLLDMIKEDEIGVDAQDYTDTITMDSDTNDLSKILKQLEPHREVTTEDGHTGVLRLDHTSVQVTTDGYKTATRNLSATRTYPNLSDADVSLIPKSITDNGSTLTLADVQWAGSEGTDGEGGAVTHYTATASYIGSTSYRYATGYTITANYTGEVAKTDCSVVTYTAIFGSVENPEGSEAPDGDEVPEEIAKPDEPSESAAHISWADLKTPLMIGGMALILVIGGAFAFKKIKRRR